METQQTQPPVLKLSWREKFAGILVLIIGIIYLLWQVADFMSSKSDAYAVKEGNFQISRAELMNHARSILSILLALIGGWLLLKGKRVGWVIGVTLLILLNTIAIILMISGFSLTDTPNKIAGGVVVLIMLLALLFLLLPSARLKVQGQQAYLPADPGLIVDPGWYLFLLTIGRLHLPGSVLDLAHHFIHGSTVIFRIPLAPLPFVQLLVNMLLL